jgi:RNA polymerase sigma-70 factor (ECF subfamily)
MPIVLGFSFAHFHPHLGNSSSTIALGSSKIHYLCLDYTWLEESIAMDIERVYAVYYPKLVRFAASYVVVLHEAENLVQNIFLQLLEKERDPGEFHNINAYLFRSVRNGCIDLLRSKIKNEQKKHPGDICGDEAILKMSAIEQFDDSCLSLEELEKTIRDAVESLPEKCREIFILSRFEDKTHSQIADTLGISTSTVNNHINTALRKLKKELKHFLPLFIFLTS